MLVELNIPVVKLNPPKSNVPAVNVVVLVADKVNVAANVVVIPVPLIVNPPSVALVFDVIVPVPTIVDVKVVNVPPLLNVKPLRFSEVVPGLNAVVPKLKLLNQLLEVNVAIAVPLPVNVKLGEISAVPPVVPNVNVLVISAAAVNPPVPVYENPVAIAIDNTVVAAVVCANTILLEPNIIARVLVLVELNIPVVKLNPPKSNVPAVNVVVLVADKVNVAANVVVIPVPLIVNPPSVALVFDVIVPVLRVAAVNPVNEPPEDNTKLITFTVAVVKLVTAVVPKFKLLNQLLVSNVSILVPVPVNVKLGAFAIVPPVVPYENVLVVAALDIKVCVPVNV